MRSSFRLLENRGQWEGGRRLPDVCAQTSQKDRTLTQEVRGYSTEGLVLKAFGVQQGAKPVGGQPEMLGRPQSGLGSRHILAAGYSVDGA